MVKHLEDRLNIKLDETTEDGLFSIKEVECMAACGGAPMLEVDKIYHENLTPEKIDQILSDIASTNLSEPKMTKNVESQRVGESSKGKKKTQRKKKKEIKPEPIIHLRRVKPSVKKSEENKMSSLERAMLRSSDNGE